MYNDSIVAESTFFSKFPRDSFTYEKLRGTLHGTSPGKGVLYILYVALDVFGSKTEPAPSHGNAVERV